MFRLYANMSLSPKKKEDVHLGHFITDIGYTEVISYPVHNVVFSQSLECLSKL